MKGIHVKTKVKIAIAAGGLLASALAAAPAQAYAATPAKAATPALSGSCSETFFCAWDQNGDLFWSTNAPNRNFPINNDVSYAENLTGYQEIIQVQNPGQDEYDVDLQPHTGLTQIDGYVTSIYT